MGSNTMYPPIDPAVTEDDHYFTIEEAHALDFGTLTPSDDQLTAMREQVEEIFERGSGRAFIPRRDVMAIRAPYEGWLRLRRPLVREIEAIDHDSVAWTEDQITELQISGSSVSGFENYYDNSTLTITYTHGMDRPPMRIKTAALLLLKLRIVEGPVDARATAITAGDGTRIPLATPNMYEWDTGIPEVDQAIKAYRVARVLG